MPTKGDLARIWADKKPAVRVGKSRLESGVVEEIIRQLKKQKIIKVRFLRTATAEVNVDTLAAALADQTASEVLGRRGSVVVLALRQR
ncbi:MAG: YhbY family RNA-binding protein [Candidatus Hodarchaeota archaeon]